MRRFDWMMLATGLIAALAWSFVSGRDGFKGSNATIVARSISIRSTIDGQVASIPPAVGARVKSDDLLVRIHNGRMDRSRLTNFDSEIQFLQLEISNTEAQQQQLEELLRHQAVKSAAHSAWMLDDIKLREQENLHQLEIAARHRELMSDQADRASELFNNAHTSSVAVETARAEAEIAASQLALGRVQLDRNRLLGTTLVSNGMFFDNGDASYWDRMIDDLTLRQIDTIGKLATLNAQLIRAQSQANVERTRVGSSIDEEHRANFSGMVNATYVTQGTRVTTGTSLLQILDCANPIVIVPVPEHRISEFAVGMDVTVYPVDTRDALAGTIEYFSSGPQIAQDQTLFVQEDLTLSGIHAVVSFTDRPAYIDPTQPCESAHRAVVVIHTKSILGTASNWVAALF